MRLNRTWLFRFVCSSKREMDGKASVSTITERQNAMVALVNRLVLPSA